MYASVEAFRDRFDRPESPELTEITVGAGGEPDLVRIEQALLEASGEMDDGFRARYAVPLRGYADSTAARLAQVCCDIARYRLWSSAASDEVVRRYVQATEWLHDIADGTLVLDADPPDGGSAGTPAYTSPDPMFSRDTLSDY
jgi:phage gp36-like protein